MASPARHPSLDGLRALAALAVVAHNLLPIRQPHDLATHALVAVLDRGWIGVQLFFVLSGFLITGGLLDAARSGGALMDFYRRRALRVVPLYYALLAVLTLLLPALGLLPPTFHRVPALEPFLWSYLWNWVAPFHPGEASFPHLWSLAVEEQFYLLWPLVALGRPPRAVWRASAAVAIASLVARVVLVVRGAPPEALYEFSVCRMDALALGAAAAAALRDPALRARMIAARGRILSAGTAVLLIGAAASGAYRVYTPAGQTIGYSALALAFALWLLGAAAADTAGDPRRAVAWLRAPWLGAVARYSYGLYLLHVPLHQLVGAPLLARWAGPGGPGIGGAIAYIALGTLASLAAAIAVYHAFEVHFLRWRDRAPGAAEGGPRTA